MRRPYPRPETFGGRVIEMGVYTLAGALTLAACASTSLHAARGGEGTQRATTVSRTHPKATPAPDPHSSPSSDPTKPTGVPMADQCAKMMPIIDEAFGASGSEAGTCVVLTASDTPGSPAIQISGIGRQGFGLNIGKWSKSLTAGFGDIKGTRFPVGGVGGPPGVVIPGAGDITAVDLPDGTIATLTVTTGPGGEAPPSDPSTVGAMEIAARALLYLNGVDPYVGAPAG